MSEKTMNLTEVAEYTGIKRRTLYNMIRTKRFPVTPIKGTDPRLWNIKDIDAWLDEK